MRYDILSVTRTSSVPSPLHDRISDVRPVMKECSRFFHGNSIGASSVHDRFSEDAIRFSRRDELDGIVYVLRHSGCRVSEILDARGCDIVSPCEFLIHGKKGSASRILRFPELSPILSDSMRFPERRIFFSNYMRVYRYLRSLGVSVREKGNRNHSVCHAFRYEKIRAICDVSRDVKTTADCIGHRSKRTSLIYISKGVSHG
jgi:integrase